MCVLLVACGTTPNPSEGDFRSDEVAPGVYSLLVSSESGPFVSTADGREAWVFGATKLCPGGYKEFGTKEVLGVDQEFSVYLHGIGPIFWSNTSAGKYGYIVCNASGLSVEDAEKLIKQEESARAQQREYEKQKQLESYGASDCAAPDEHWSVEKFHGLGKVLYSLGRYDKARVCFLKAYQSGEIGPAYRDSCLRLGAIHELGLGVPPDLEVAKMWYARAAVD